MLSKFFIDRPVFAWVIALFILLAGLLAIPNLPVSQYPQIAPPTIIVNSVYPGASAQTVDESVTSLIEQEMNGAENMLYIESQSQADGQSSVNVTFRIESLTRKLQVPVLAGAPFLNGWAEGLQLYQNAGIHPVKGQPDPVEV